MASRNLAQYRAKRNFRVTAEPSGAATVAAAGQRRFVIQKHAARRLHYDLRLEWDGVFKSWAVTRGPSLDPADKRLAVEVEDHPLDYGDFEGTIPRGEYGGGTVMVWDRGYWAPDGDESPAQALRQGNLKFRLDGEKLHGSWVLVRMRTDRQGGKRTNWLLIKHRDEHARPGRGESILDEDRSVASARSMPDIEAGKGRGPQPFMRQAKGRAHAKAVWHSNKANQNDADAKQRLQPERASAAAKTNAGSARSSTTAAAAGSKSKAAAFGGQGRAQRSSSAGKAPPRFISPQLAKLVERAPNGPGWVHEIKIDGYRLQLRVTNGAATLRTRRGLDWTNKFPRIAAAAEAFPDCIIDGEVAAFDSKGVLTFHALQEALAEGNDAELVYFVFDLLFEAGTDLRKLPLIERKDRLHTLLEQAKPGSAIQYVEHFETRGESVLKSACRMHLEGIMSKQLDAPYRSGRGDSWAKAKCRGGQEVVIGGWTQEGGRMRSLLVGVHRNGKLEYAGRVGTGFGAETQKILWPRLKATASDHSPFAGADAPRKKPDMRWSDGSLVAEIEFAGWTGSGRVRQAAFKGLREDKPPSEIHEEKPAAAPDARSTRAVRGTQSPSASHRGTAAKGAKYRAAARGAAHTDAENAGVMGVPLSKPDKVLWPDDGAGKPITKLDLAKYFEAVGPWMIGHIAGRPCSLVRVPDGIKGRQHFFQRHAMKGQSHLIDTVKVSGDREPYLQIDRVEALAALAQMAALELHPWNCLPGNPELPGRLVFDIDPAPDVAFDKAIDAALELRERLERLGLVTFCKTTGGKGLHVVTELMQPKQHPIDWPTAKTFAQTLCQQMADDSPDRYLIVMTKKLRSGRIFLDYLRNDRTATAVAPLSPRARDGAPVSMPLNWPQVRHGLEPKRFTVSTAPALMQKNDPWKDYIKSARPLIGAIQQLTGSSGSLRNRKKAA